MQRLLEITDEKEARKVIAGLAPEGSQQFAYLLKCWRRGYVIL